MSSNAIPTTDNKPADLPPSQDNPAPVNTGHGTPMAVVLTLGAEGTRILARITRLSADRLRLAPGDAVHAQVKAVRLLRA